MTPHLLSGHPHIKTAPITSEGTENACNWLLRSPNTESYDITELASENGWNVWMSFVKMDHRCEWYIIAES